MIELRHITKSYNGLTVLTDINMTFRDGGCYCLMGPSGSGKTTLMRILMGLETPDEGTVAGNPDRKSAAISAVFQEDRLCESFSPMDNVMMCVGRSLKASRVRLEMGELLPEECLDRPVSTLSGGMKRRVAVLRALLTPSDILIMDEPTSALTSKEIDELFRIIRKLKKEGHGIVYISHRLEEFQHIVDRVTIMRDGQYIMSGDFKDLTMDKMISYMVGREIKEKFPRVQCEKGKKIFEVRNLNAGRMVRDINFSVYEGEIVGFAGLMGAGRTETTRAIFGVDPKDSGEIYVDGKEVKINGPLDAIRNGVVLAPEDRKKDGLCTKLSIRENMALPNLDLIGKHGIVNSSKEDELCEKIVKDLQIKTPNVEIDSGNLSGGNQQKVVVGKWLARNSRVVIFDEPTRGIDVGAKVEIYNLMNQLKQQGIAVMFVSSEMPEVMGLADRIIVMCDGRITGELTAAEATQDYILKMATSFENKNISDSEGE